MNSLFVLFCFFVLLFRFGFSVMSRHKPGQCNARSEADYNSEKGVLHGRMDSFGTGATRETGSSSGLCKAPSNVAKACCAFRRASRLARAALALSSRVLASDRPD